MNYTVQPGDSLSKIAAKLLGPSGTWEDMIRFNPDIDDPDVISVGQVLYIPDNSVVQSSQSSTSSDSSSHSSGSGFDISQYLNLNTGLYIGAGILVLAAFLLIPKKGAKIKEATS